MGFLASKSHWGLVKNSGCWWIFDSAHRSVELSEIFLGSTALCTSSGCWCAGGANAAMAVSQSMGTAENVAGHELQPLHGYRSPHLSQIFWFLWDEGWECWSAFTLPHQHCWEHAVSFLCSTFFCFCSGKLCWKHRGNLEWWNGAAPWCAAMGQGLAGQMGSIIAVGIPVSWPVHPVSVKC